MLRLVLIHAYKKGPKDATVACIVMFTIYAQYCKVLRVFLQIWNDRYIIWNICYEDIVKLQFTVY